MQDIESPYQAHVQISKYISAVKYLNIGLVVNVANNIYCAHMRLKFPVNLQGTKVQIFDSKNTFFVGSNHHHSEYDPGLKRAYSKDCFVAPRLNTWPVGKGRILKYIQFVQTIISCLSECWRVLVYIQWRSTVSFVHKINCQNWTTRHWVKSLWGEWCELY